MSNIPCGSEQLIQLRAFISMCRAKPDILKHSELSFFRDYLLELGARIPEGTTESETKPKQNEPSAETPKPPKVGAECEDAEMESEESDVQLDLSGIVEPDEDAPLPMGEKGKEVSEADMEKSDEKKREAINAFAEGDYQKACDLYTEAIILNSGSALLYAKRGQVLLKLGKPNACVRDCNRALEANPDCAAALKFRGRAHRLLGRWEEAARDLRDACKIDFDEQADEWLREVTPNARKLEEHRRKCERKRAERELQERLRRAKHAREEHARVSAEQQQQQQEPQPTDSADGAGIYSILSDPDVMEAFQDPDFANAITDITKNPHNWVKYQNNPKIVAGMEKLTSKFAAAGLGDAFSGGRFPPGGGSAPPPPPPSAAGDDIGLD